jgi:flavin reductase (DIM6/NTAB) family NADH-FMN oxidoreductase RutF
MREVLGHFCSGVTVITAMCPDGPVGFTCQSFTSLSLHPPMVSFAPARSSTSWPKVRAARRFCINVLADDQQHISKAFARSGTDKFAGVKWCAGRHGAPALAGAVARIDCELWAEYAGGDHTIVAASVVGLTADQARAPLLFHRGGYGVRRPEAAGA